MIETALYKPTRNSGPFRDPFTSGCPAPVLFHRSSFTCETMAGLLDRLRIIFS